MLVDQIKEHLDKSRGGYFDSLEIIRGDLVGYIGKDKLVELFGWLKDDPDLQFNHLSMITAADYLDTRDKRFEVVYVLYSISQHHRLMVKIKIDDDEPVPSLTAIWDTANWQEREVYDMFGIVFEGHPALTRILMDEDWVGYPQRKDFPLTYEDPAFSHNLDRIKLKDKTPGEELS